MEEHTISTIEDLAVLIQRTMASKEDVQGLGDEVKRLEEKVDHGFARIEKLLIEDHRRRIEVLEGDLKRLKEALAI